MNNYYIKAGALIFCIVSAITLNSCKHDIDLSTAPTISFKDDIQAIIGGNCAKSGCHGDDSQSKFSLTSYNKVMEEGDIKAGNA